MTFLADKSLLNYFLQIGRRIFRQRLETGNRESAVEERRVFVFPHLSSNLFYYLSFD